MSREQTGVVFQFHRGERSTEKFQCVVAGDNLESIGRAISAEIRMIGREQIAESVGGSVERMTIELTLEQQVGSGSNGSINALSNPQSQGD
jgi:hypothetical protein